MDKNITSMNISDPGLNVLPPGVERYLVNGGGLTGIQIFPEDKIEIINNEGNQICEILVFNKEKKSDNNSEQQKIASNVNQDLSPEDRARQQNLEQWLRKIPDDPGRLLRNKMKREYQRRDKKQIESKQYW